MASLDELSGEEANLVPGVDGGVTVPQPHHHSTQTGQASAIHDQALARAIRFLAEHIGRLRRHQARHPIGQLHRSYNTNTPGP